MEIRSDLSLDDRALAVFCRRHSIRRLAVFGSVPRDDFSDGSDVDVLVKFAPGRTPGLLSLAAMELELSGLVGGREVELRTYEDLSRQFRDGVRDSAVPLYAAAQPEQPLPYPCITHAASRRRVSDLSHDRNVDRRRRAPMIRVSTHPQDQQWSPKRNPVDHLPLTTPPTTPLWSRVWQQRHDPRVLIVGDLKASNHDH